MYKSRSKDVLFFQNRLGKKTVSLLRISILLISLFIMGVAFLEMGLLLTPVLEETDEAPTPCSVCPALPVAMRPTHLCSLQIPCKGQAPFCGDVHDALHSFRGFPPNLNSGAQHP